ncbi:SMP-30/gluconolactonase/LRE family protein [Novosphingobium sp. TH158]|uniref:SMP-30/gluconolactonase/LRE family protein n=1 Tax=Novosphingobium sp. TH158 TaxID=2067455 RepID=UPI000C7C0B5A|nr:SMP-30/gluconolactonase/LRE family protein [Novosphingobium sp. TH158]PLK25948.1 gluconolactonase [Novosphingobium sp. TH158]
MTEVEAACSMRCELGEGPAWFATEAELHFVDIAKGQLHLFKPATGKLTTASIGGKPSFVLPFAGGGRIVGSRHELLLVDASGYVQPLANIPQPSGNRTNDATVDAAGRLWFGTMDDGEEQPSGTIWCLAGGQLTRSSVSAVVTNGPAISPDGRTLYYADSQQGVVYRCAMDGVSLADPQPFLAIDDGFPDGLVADEQGNIWVALWDGWCVRLYSPAGRHLRTVELPCARPTKVALGGPARRTAYVTSARTGLDEAKLSRQPLAGSLFRFEVDVPGQIVRDVVL